MKKIYKFVLPIVLAIGIICSGCGAKFDATGYVQSLLDANYKGEYTKYLELTEDTKENAVANYETVMKMKSDMFQKAMGATVDESLNEEFLAVVKEMFAKAEYRVEEAEENNDEYIVTIVVKPINILTNIMEKGENYIEEFNARNQAGEFTGHTEAQYYQEYTQGILDIFRNEVENITYADEVSIDVKVHKATDGSNLYVIDESVYREIDSAIFLYE